MFQNYCVLFRLFNIAFHFVYNVGPMYLENNEKIKNSMRLGKSPYLELLKRSVKSIYLANIINLKIIEIF